MSCYLKINKERKNCCNYVIGFNEKVRISTCIFEYNGEDEIIFRNKCKTFVQIKYHNLQIELISIKQLELN